MPARMHMRWNDGPVGFQLINDVFPGGMLRRTVLSRLGDVWQWPIHFGPLRSWGSCGTCGYVAFVARILAGCLAEELLLRDTSVCSCWLHQSSTATVRRSQASRPRMTLQLHPDLVTHDATLLMWAPKHRVYVSVIAWCMFSDDRGLVVAGLGAGHPSFCHGRRDDAGTVDATIICQMAFTEARLYVRE